MWEKILFENSFKIQTLKKNCPLNFIFINIFEDSRQDPSDKKHSLSYIYLKNTLTILFF